MFKTRGSHDDIVDNKPPLGPLPKHVHSTKHEEFDPVTPVKTVLIFADIDRADTFSAFTIDILPQKRIKTHIFRTNRSTDYYFSIPMADPARQMSKFQGNWPKSRQFRIKTDVMEGAIFISMNLAFDLGDSRRHQLENSGDIPVRSRCFGSGGLGRSRAGGDGRSGAVP